MPINQKPLTFPYPIHLPQKTKTPEQQQKVNNNISLLYSHYYYNISRNNEPSTLVIPLVCPGLLSFSKLSFVRGSAQI